MGIQNDFDCEDNPNLTEKEEPKKRKISLFTIIFLFLVFALFFWAIWNAFLSSFVPRHRTLFGNYDNFRNKAENSGLSLELPKTASDTEYYWGIHWFIEEAGYGTALSDEDYESVKLETIKSYQETYEGTAGVTLYVYSESDEKEWVQEEWLEKYNIEETEELLGKDEAIEDYYVLAFRYTDSDRITYTNCMLCNDSSKRIIEISCIDRNASVRNGKP